MPHAQLGCDVPASAFFFAVLFGARICLREGRLQICSRYPQSLPDATIAEASRGGGRDDSDPGPNGRGGACLLGGT